MVGTALVTAVAIVADRMAGSQPETTATVPAVIADAPVPLERFSPGSLPGISLLEQGS